DVSANALGSGTLFGRRVEAFSVNPVNSQIVLAAIELGGVWRSNDGGNHWSHVDSLPLTAMDDVKFAPTDPSLVFATGRYDGTSTATGAELYRSTDGGATWTRTTNNACGDAAGHSAHRIAIVGGAPGSVEAWVATDCELLHTTNSGTSWTRVTPQGNAQYWDVKSVGTPPNNIVDTCGATGFARSTNGGTSWSPADLSASNPIRYTGVSNGDGSGYVPCRVTTAPGNTNVVFLTSGIRLGGSNGINKTQILEHDSGGAAGSWVNLNGTNDGNGRPPNVITVPGFDGNANHFELFYANDSRFLHQQCDLTNLGSGTACGAGDGNNGGAFSVYDNSIDGVHHSPDASDIAFGDDGCPFLEGGDGGVFRTSNGCNGSPTFTQSNAGLHGLQSTGMAGSVYSGHTDLYYGTQDNGIFNSGDGGGSWSDRGPDVYGVF